MCILCEFIDIFLLVTVPMSSDKMWFFFFHIIKLINA